MTIGDCVGSGEYVPHGEHNRASQCSHCRKQITHTKAGRLRVHKPHTKTCHNCGQRAAEHDATLVPRKVGGSYRRASRTQPCNICRDCTVRLVRTLDGWDGHLTVGRWSRTGLVRAYILRFECPYCHADGPLRITHAATRTVCGMPTDGGDYCDRHKDGS